MQMPDPTAPQRFFELNDCWEHPDYPRRKRFIVDVTPLGEDLDSRVRRCERIDPATWEVPRVAVVSSGDGPEDLPFAGWSTLVVSDRLRRILEQHAPGEIQFLPLGFANTEVDCGAYWAAVLLQTVDCVDPERAVVYEVGSKPTLFRLAIRADSIPDSVNVCRVKGAWYNLIVRDVLAGVLRREECTGVMLEQL
ncbi:MAG: hypothetical protein H6810_00280 [Phycisphaeraceae bacterium]|nr:MAG: hypothetical protein H6810_00280 [Phycisphaeraceae bacterium]